jgi:hypothetical protein
MYLPQVLRQVLLFRQKGDNIMPKLIAFVLVAVMVLGLCACSSNQNNDKTTEPTPTVTEPSTTEAEIDSIDPALFIGVWESEYSHLEIREDGVGMYKAKEDDYNREFDLTWKIIDNQLVITIHYMDMEHVSIFDMNDDFISLTLIQNMLPVQVTPDSDYFKQ